MRTQLIGKGFHHFQELDSTNAYALRLLAEEDPPEGMVISADFQRSGRGQQGSRWEGAPGENLSLSVILYPRFLPADRLFLLSQATALAASDLLTAVLGEAARIKWPNDLILQRRKLGGILIQNSLQGAYCRHSVAGIGLNINQENISDHLPQAISLAEVAGHHFSLPEMRLRLCACLDERYRQLREGDEEKIQKAYHDRLFLRGEMSRFRDAHGTLFTGMVEGVAPDGKLQLRVGDELRNCELKEVQWVWEKA